MRIGVPKEIKAQEYRVGLTPGAVREYVAHGHSVLVETGAGQGIGASDEAYVEAGAAIAPNPEAVFADAGMIVKVKEPQACEVARLRAGQILFAYLHLAADKDLALRLAATGAAAVAYETVTDPFGGLPLLAPMSEVAGRLSVQAAAECLKRHAGGRGVLIGGVPGVSPARIVILGGGVVGTQAARVAVGMGAQVTVIDRSLPRLRQLDELFSGRIRTRAASTDAIEAEVIGADAVIGAVLIPGARTPKLVTRAMLSRMQAGAVLVDVAIDQGGCFETSRPTSYDAPTFIEEGIVHYCVANMPGAVPLTASEALNNATLPFGLAIADGGLRAIQADPHLAAGLNTLEGEIVNAAVATSLGL